MYVPGYCKDSNSKEWYTSVLTVELHDLRLVGEGGVTVGYGASAEQRIDVEIVKFLVILLQHGRKRLTSVHVVIRRRG